MAYSNYQNNKKFNNNRNKDSNNDFEIVTKSLSQYFSNPKDLYLPGGKAEKYAKLFERIPSHQIRKVLDAVKEAKLTGEKGMLQEAKSKMFVIVAMSAYNSGRLTELKPLYGFIKNTISEESVKTLDDIKSFDQFFTSVVAYHKQYSKGK